MRLNIVGDIVEKCWREIPKHFPNVELDEYVIMPNHIHGIIVLHDNGRDLINQIPKTSTTNHRDTINHSALQSTYV